MELGPQNHNKDGHSGLNSIMVVYMVRRLAFPAPPPPRGRLK